MHMHAPETDWQKEIPIDLNLYLINFNTTF